MSAGEASEFEQGDLWVFGYGSLMWRPGFLFNVRVKATVEGWGRRLCIYSHVYRGTPERPGLVLGLDRGGECVGIAFHVEERLRDSTIQYLRDRELVTAVYLEKTVNIILDTGQTVEAITYVADHLHHQYAPPMTSDRLLAVVKQGVGRSGKNSEYVINTHDHLLGIGIVDPELSWLATELRRP